MPLKLATAVPMLAAYALSAAVAFAAYRLHLPLAWILGPLIVAAALSLAGVPLDPPQALRRLGQLGIGAAVGLTMTAPVIAELARWLPVMALSALTSIVVSALLSVPLARLAGIDRTSAFFANLPGGLAEMANIGAKVGARPEPVATVQTLRVALVVLVVPPTLLSLGLSGTGVAIDAAAIPAWWVPVLLALGSVGAIVLGFARLNNPWMIGSLVATGALAASGALEGRMPSAVFFAAQLLIGFAVGARFKPAMIRKLPRVTAAGSLSILVSATIMVGFAAAVAGVSGLDFPTAVLATSPGGMSEMAATAQVLHLNVALVVGFQVMRAFMVNSLASYYWLAFSAAEKRLARLFGRGAGTGSKEDGGGNDDRH